MVDNLNFKTSKIQTLKNDSLSELVKLYFDRWLFPNLQGLIDVKVTKIALDAAELLVDPL